MARDWRLRSVVPVAAVFGLASAFSTGALAASKAADDKGAPGDQAEAGTQGARRRRPPKRSPVPPTPSAPSTTPPS